MEKSKVYIYNIICLSTGKGYIGSTINTYKRKSGHFEKLRKKIHYNSYLQNAFNKYGEENFTFDVIFSCCSKYRNKIESWFINKSSFSSEFNYLSVDNRNYDISCKYKKLKKEDILLIKEYICKGLTVKEIAKLLKVSKNSISKIINNEYYIDVILSKDIIKILKENNSNHLKNIMREQAEKVFAYKINGEFIGEFNSIPDAAEALNFKRNAVSNALNRGIQLKGYLFYRQPKVFTEYISNIHGTNLLIYDINFNLIDSMKYMKKAQEKYDIKVNTINNACNRLHLCNKQFYFVREKDKQKFETKFNLLNNLATIGNDKIAILLIDQELGNF